jgi:alpha-2-macroglobulin
VRVAIHTADGHGRPVAADVGVALVDAAVLALAANANGTLSDAFYAQRPLGIGTATSMALYVDRLNITPGNGHKGGSGGGATANGPASVRVKFPDTAYWNPNVLTDAHGNAAFTLTLPDNLTTWHLSADASTTARTLLGTGGADLVATKPVLIEPALPRFLTVRDDSRLGAVVSNLTDRAVRLSVSGTATIGAGRGVLHTPGQNHLALDYPLPATAVTVPAHGDRAVYWAYVPQVEGPLAVTLDARAATPGLSDALRITLPVEENSLISPEAAATAGDVSSAAVTETVILPGTIEPGEGDLRLTLEPTLVSGLAGAGNYLLSYPYDGVEQVASRLIGLLALTSLPAYAHGSFGAALPTLAPRLIARLYTLQGYDGGWGWWPEDPSDPYLSAYAYDALIQARARGFAIDRAVLSNATHYLQGRLTAPPGALYAPDDATRAFILYVLGRAGYPDPGEAAVLYGRRSGLGGGGRAEIALALSGAFGAHDPRVRTLVNELSDAARMTSIDAHWDAGPRADWETMETSESDTAEALRMLIALDPRSPLIPRAVRWLMAQRGIGAPGAGPGPDGAWQSTQATALALRTVARYALQFGDTHPHYRYRLGINGPTVQEGIVTPDTAGRPRSVVVPTDALQAAGGKGAVGILRQALPDGPPVTATPLHYTLRLRYYPVPGSVGAVDSGISITRRYVTHNGVPVGNRAPAGSTLLVELHLVAPQGLSRVLIEDPLPAGAEAVDGSLLTSSVFAQPGRTPGSPGHAPPRPGQPEDLSPYVDHVELRDDRTALFASAIPAGRYVYRYALHLTTPGVYHVLPAHAAQLYEPEVFGHTAEASFAVW